MKGGQVTFQMLTIILSFPLSFIDNKQPSQQKPWLGAKPLPTLPNQSSSKPKKPAALPPPSAALKPNLPPKLTDEEVRLQIDLASHQMQS